MWARGAHIAHKLSSAPKRARKILSHTNNLNQHKGKLPNTEFGPNEIELTIFGID